MKYLLLISFLFLLAPQAHAAIGFDSAASHSFGVVSTGNLAVTVAATNETLVCAVQTNASTNVVSSITFNGSAMTIIGSGVHDTNNAAFLTMYYLNNPSTGTNNVSFNSTTVSVDVDCEALSGTTQSGQPDSSNTGTAGSGTTFPLSTTVMTSNSWGVLFSLSTHGTVQNGTNATLRTNSSSNIGLYDTNAAKPSGSLTMTASITGASSQWSGIIASFAPVPPTPAPSGIQTTWNGVQAVFNGVTSIFY